MGCDFSLDADKTGALAMSIKFGGLSHGLHKKFTYDT